MQSADRSPGLQLIVENSLSIRAAANSLLWEKIHPSSDAMFWSAMLGGLSPAMSWPYASVDTLLDTLSLDIHTRKASDRYPEGRILAEAPVSLQTREQTLEIARRADELKSVLERRGYSVTHRVGEYEMHSLVLELSDKPPVMVKLGFSDEELLPPNDREVFDELGNNPISLRLYADLANLSKEEFDERFRYFAKVIQDFIESMYELFGIGVPFGQMVISEATAHR